MTARPPTKTYLAERDRRASTKGWLTREATKLAQAPPGPDLDEAVVAAEVEHWREVEVRSKRTYADALDRLGCIVREMNGNRGGAWTQPWIAEEIGSTYQWVQRLKNRSTHVPADITKATADQLLVEMRDLAQITQRCEALAAAARARWIDLVDRMVRQREVWTLKHAHRVVGMTWMWRTMYAYWDLHHDGYRPPHTRRMATGHR